MSRSSLQDQTNIPLIVTTNDGGTARSSTGTSLDSCSFKAKSCRSFYSRSSNQQQQKLNSESHRNRSVPHNLQVWQLCGFFHTHRVHFSEEQLTFICIIYIVASPPYENRETMGKMICSNILWYFCSHKKQWECIRKILNELLKKHMRSKRLL